MNLRLRIRRLNRAIISAAAKHVGKPKPSKKIEPRSTPLPFHCLLRTPNPQRPYVPDEHRESQRLRSAICSRELAHVRRNRAFSSSLLKEGTKATNCNRVLLLTLHYLRTRQSRAGPDDTLPTFLKALGPAWLELYSGERERGHRVINANRYDHFFASSRALKSSVFGPFHHMICESILAMSSIGEPCNYIHSVIRI